MAAAQERDLPRTLGGRVVDEPEGVLNELALVARGRVVGARGRGPAEPAGHQPFPDRSEAADHRNVTALKIGGVAVTVASDQGREIEFAIAVAAPAETRALLAVQANRHDLVGGRVHDK